MSGGGVRFCPHTIVCTQETFLALCGAAAEMLALANQRGEGTCLWLTAAAGDGFILQLATVLKSVARRSDFIFRWGADEFAFIPEGTTAETAVGLAERLRTAVEERTAGTISVGIYHGIPSSADEALAAADAAMYAAKQGGKNRVVLNGHRPPK
jgi:predicted signal transduction protein with EAL and GGDEF domain